MVGTVVYNMVPVVIKELQQQIIKIKSWEKVLKLHI
jgi:hypothetical protein